jgi:IS605 OrfB family transposase
MVKVAKFLNISKREFQKAIWHHARQNRELKEAHTRLLDLLSQRFASTVMGNLLYPLDERNYSFVKRGKWYSVEVRFEPKTKVAIPIARPERKYYADILDGTAYPAFIYKHGADYFMSVEIPFKEHYEESRQTVYVGIDLNQRKHAASLYNPETREFERNIFFDLKPVDERIKKIQWKISAIQRGERTSGERESIRDLYERIDKTIEKGHGDFISKLTGVADEYWKKGYNVVFVLEDLRGITKRAGKEYPAFNRWLHSQWCYRRFGILLETHGYPVKYVDPMDTSAKCYRCGAKVEIYGKHGRLIKCNVCGLRDFSRDLNAARNILKSLDAKLE